MAETEPTGDWAYLEILDRFLRDGERGVICTLESYLGMYPGNEAVVQQVWDDVMVAQSDSLGSLSGSLDEPNTPISNVFH